MRKAITDDVWRDILNRLVLKPRLKAAARAAGINSATLFTKIKHSIAASRGAQAHLARYVSAPFHEHVSAARRLSIVELDRAALQLGLEGHSTAALP